MCCPGFKRLLDIAAFLVLALLVTLGTLGWHLWGHGHVEVELVECLDGDAL